MQSLTHKPRAILNGWPLFWLVTAVISTAMVLRMVPLDLGRPEDVSTLIAWSVRWSVPWLFLAFAASSVQTLFPGAAGRWLLRNRRMIGLCFAAGMGWQAFFILLLTTVHADYYYAEVYVLRDAIEGTLGYLFLAAMTLTSFRFARRHLSTRRWRLLHTVGIYYLWAYAFSVYWHELFYYEGPGRLDIVYYVAGAAALALRIAAWARKRARRGRGGEDRPVAAALGYALVAAALAGTIGGTLWGGPAYDTLWDTRLFSALEAYLPYWPFIPFLPAFAAVAGAAVLARTRTANNYREAHP